jgi:hypothetical protein
MTLKSYWFLYKHIEVIIFKKIYIFRNKNLNQLKWDTKLRHTRYQN